MDAGLLAMGDLFGDERREEVVVGPLLLFGAGDEVAPGTARVGQVEALEKIVEVEVDWLHENSSC